MKRLLPLRKAAAGDQDDPPNRLPREIFPSGIKPLCSPEDSAIDIVFVHGLTGNRDNTWTAQDETEPWPQTLLSSILTTARVLTFGYDAYVADWRGMVSQNRIANHAWNLLTSLASYRENDDTALVTSRQRPERHLQNILRSTRGIIFLGTPHHGAGLARWAELLSRSIGLVKQTNSKIVDVLRRDSEVLARIQDSFHTMVMARSKEGLPPIEISCFYEELALPGVGLVVPQDSAILPGYIPIGIRGNHRDMTKFTSIDDPGFVAVCGELRRWIRDMSAAETGHEKPLLSSNSDFDEQPGTANQFGDGNRMFNNFGGSQKNIEGGNYESGGGTMNIGIQSHNEQRKRPQGRVAKRGYQGVLVKAEVSQVFSCDRVICPDQEPRGYAGVTPSRPGRKHFPHTSQPSPSSDPEHTHSPRRSRSHYRPAYSPHRRITSTGIHEGRTAKRISHPQPRNTSGVRTFEVTVKHKAQTEPSPEDGNAEN
ncbi:hypothetical protein DL764_009146 [Monosporascus ibericus]|uniref:Uncharacterized protein n=1 Tax=Monosporascus ibericus TaxID=155417 RepID=A0A4Q4SXX0_9PEZI|nr:hypothetical protein DL764_009146 [Monosporascus ibericus]